MPRTLDLRFNQQQLELIDRALTQGYAASRADLIRRAIAEHGRPKPPRKDAAAAAQPAIPVDLPREHTVLLEHVMQPVPPTIRCRARVRLGSRMRPRPLQSWERRG